MSESRSITKEDRRSVRWIGPPSRLAELRAFLRGLRSRLIPAPTKLNQGR
jgi:hypothetical protein